MKKIFLIFLLTSIFACSKYRYNEKQLPGLWTVQTVRIEDGEGFVFFDSLATGSFLIDAAKMSGNANYTYSYFGQYDVSDAVIFDQSACSLSSGGDFLLIERATDTLEAKIIVLSSKHLTFEYYDYLQYRLKRFSCARN